jgi:aryl-phospho-beta-D-glucosidase BglC (GH1 family)
MWQFLADRYKNKPGIAAYEILSEPHPKKPATGIDVRTFYEALINEIRKVDQRTPLMIGANDHYDINLLEEVYTNVDENIIYTFNFYLPTEYIKPEKREQAGLPLVAYPSTFTNLEGQEVQLNKDYLVDVIQPAIRFRDEHDVPVLINQVGARSRCPGHLQYMEDVGDIFRQHHVPFTYWTYRTQDDSTEYGLYWYDKKKDSYVLKEDQWELIGTIFRQ